MIDIFKRLALVDWRFFIRQAKWAMQWQIYLPEGTDVARAIDDGDLDKAKLLLANFEKLIGDMDHPEIIHFRTLIAFEEEFPVLVDGDSELLNSIED